MKCTIEFVNDEGEEVSLPAIYEVCLRCGGTGKHDHPAFSNGITMDEWYGPDWDDESREMYMSGAYDVTCTECDGKRVVLVVDQDRLTDEQVRIFGEYVRMKNQHAAEEASERHLRMMESGGY